MPLQIIRNDITKVECDAIVNAANKSLLGGGGVDGAIHKAAGRELLEECRKLNGCKVGEAKITGGYNLPCKYVIHTVGPIWQGGLHNEKELLISCYEQSLKLAKENNCNSVSFPLISSGVYGYPMDDAFNIAVNTISNFLMNNDMLVYIVVYNKTAFNTSKKLFKDIEQYIDDNYIDEHYIERSTIIQNNVQLNYTATKAILTPSKFDDSFDDEIDNIVSTLDESFSQMLLRLIDEKGIKDSECYKKANIDKRLFSKIRSNVNYSPSKTTALAFCVSLELSLDDAKEMLQKAGFALSHSNKFDVIVEYFIKNKNYNIFEINEVLFNYDLCLLGSQN